MSDAARILVIEDEPEIRRFLRASLAAEHFAAQESETGQAGLRAAAAQPPDVVLLDLGLPDIGGLEVIRQLRGWSRVPIIVLSARGQEADKIAALDAGADDYLTKPFGIGELLARLRVALRHRSSRGETPSQEFTHGAVRVDLVRRRVLVAGQEVHLTPTEYRLLTTLIQHAGKVLTHRQLLKEVWGPDCTHETHYLRVYVNQLRQKLGDDAARPQLLLTEPGVGYRLREEIQNSEFGTQTEDL
ncbi:MAG TPA: response regulator [Pirellulaceae bacterium]|nr:response regulator [Pirellulaceae bacterium]